jgi:hypothetical protein
MTNQEFFDAYVKHLRKQGQKARLASGCVYSMTDANGNELCCGVGGVMSPELRADIASARASQNRMAIDELIEENPRVGEYFAGVDVRLMGEAQCVHDALPTGEWEHEFRRIAGEFNLKVPE